MEELQKALADYEEAMDVAFDVELRATAGEMLAEKIKSILEGRDEKIH